jgi:hypothetical protein
MSIVAKIGHTCRPHVGVRSVAEKSIGEGVDSA